MTYSDYREKLRIGFSDAEKLGENIKMIAEKIAQAVNPQKIYLFGSYAKGSFRKDSDYDFYVIVGDEAEPFSLCDLAYRSLWDVERKPCDIIVARRSQFEERKSLPTLERIVEHEGVVLYEK